MEKSVLAFDETTPGFGGQLVDFVAAMNFNCAEVLWRSDGFEDLAGDSWWHVVQAGDILSIVDGELESHVEK